MAITKSLLLDYADSYHGLVREIEKLDEKRKVVRAILVKHIEPGETFHMIRHDVEKVIRGDKKLREDLTKEGFFDLVTKHTFDTEKLKAAMKEFPVVRKLVRHNRKHRLVIVEEED